MNKIQFPTGGQLAAGQASIAQSGAVMNINQSSNRAEINWQSSSNTLRFAQTTRDKTLILSNATTLEWLL